MKKVKNNHSGKIAIAGVEILPGRTVGIDAEKLRVAMGSKAIQAWAKAGVFSVDGDTPASDTPAAPPASDTPAAPPMARPADPEHVHNAGTPDEMWWNGSAWVPAVAEPTDRDALEERAKELGVKGVVATMRDATLEKKIAEAEEKSS